MKTTFLIVTPSYNQAHFIQQTIDSVLAQRSKNIDVEYVVMDAKSTDQTVKILKRYVKELEWVSEKDKGQTDAINKGILRISSKFQVTRSKTFSNAKFQSSQSSTIDHRPSFVFAYINSDDYYLPGAFEKVAQAFTEQPENDWLIGDAVIIDSQNREIQRPIRLYKQFFRLFPSWLWLILNPIPQPATFIRWSAIQKVGEFNDALRYTMDYEYWLRLRKQVGTPIVLDEPLAAFRIHGDSKGGSQFDKQFAEELAVAQRFTDNALLLTLHKLHNALILFVYRLIK